MLWSDHLYVRLPVRLRYDRKICRRQAFNRSFSYVDLTGVVLYCVCERFSQLNFIWDYNVWWQQQPPPSPLPRSGGLNGSGWLLSFWLFLFFISFLSRVLWRCKVTPESPCVVQKNKFSLVFRESVNPRVMVKVSKWYLSLA